MTLLPCHNPAATVQRRVKSFLTMKKQWKSRREVEDARIRYRVMFNDKSHGLHPLCDALRDAGSDVASWIRQTIVG